MARMPSQIELYEEISALSTRMVTAAQSGDWDNLIELERDVARLRDTLLVTSEPPSLEDAERKRVLIQRILDDDAEIRRHTEPWMEHVRHLLGDNRRLREMQRAYAAATSPPGEAA